MKIEYWKRPEDVEKRRPKLKTLVLAGLIFLINLTPVFATVADNDATRGAIILSMTLLLITGMVFLRYGIKDR